MVYRVARGAGRLSLIADGPVHIDAVPGLVVLVHAGCLWLPRPQAQGSVPLCAGEQAEWRGAGPLRFMAARGLEIELVWPWGPGPVGAPAARS
ncbi:MAG: hypothetical protein KIT17_15025 [Rubrivivax sp.]|nr:hypothetical protein [Rubrivivax sp.]